MCLDEIGDWLSLALVLALTGTAPYIPMYVRLLPLVWLFPLKKGSIGAAWR